MPTQEENKKIVVTDTDTMRRISTNSDTWPVTLIMLYFLLLLQKNFSVMIGPMMTLINFVVSNKLKRLHLEKQFKDIYRSFNRKQSIGALAELISCYPTVYYDLSSEILLVVRKYQLSLDEIDGLITLLAKQESDVDLQTHIAIAQIIKYAVLHGSEANPKLLLGAIKDCSSIEVKLELLCALASQLRKQQDAQDVSLNEVRDYIDNHFSEDTIPFHKKQLLISAKKEFFDEADRIAFMSSTTISGPLRARVTSQGQHQYTGSVSPGLARVQKKSTSQFVKSESEELRATELDLMKLLKKSRKVEAKSAQSEILPPRPQKNGSVRSWYKSPYYEVKYIYGLVKDGTLLSEEDIDYLCHKFMGMDYGNFFTNSKKFFYPARDALFIDRMIAEALRLVSTRQQLDKHITFKLVTCLGSFESAQKRILGTNSMTGMVGSFTRDHLTDAAYKNEPAIIANSATKFTASEDKVTRLRIINSEIDAIRFDAIRALHNVVSYQPDILGSTELQHVSGCLKSSNRQIKQYAIKIALRCNDGKSIPDADIFEATISNLEGKLPSQDEIKRALDYMNIQINVPRINLFNDRALSVLVKLLIHTSLDIEIRSDAAFILNQYLNCQASKPLATDQIRLLLDFFSFNKVEKQPELIYNFINVLILHAKKDVQQAHLIFAELFKKYDQLGKASTDLILLSADHFLNMKCNIPGTECLVSKLADDSDITIENLDEEQYRPPSSLVAAQLFVRQYARGLKSKHSVVSALSQALSSHCKQTRILSAKSLFLSKYAIMDNTILVRVRHCLHDSIHDVAVYAAVTYVEGLLALATNEEALWKSHLESLPDLYAFNDVTLGKDDYTDQINIMVLMVLDNELSKQTFPANIFTIFNFILLGMGKHTSYVLEILHKYVVKHKQQLPDGVIEALEKLATSDAFSENVLVIFKSLVDNGHAIPNSIITHYQHHLYNLSNKDKYYQAVDVLRCANENQDINSDAYLALNMCLAAESIVRRKNDKEGALSYLREVSKTENLLPVSIIMSLVDCMSDTRALEIVRKAARNGQEIPISVLHAIAKNGLEGENQQLMVDIILIVVRNNQGIPSLLIDQISTALNGNVRLILPVFSALSQSGVDIDQKTTFELFCEQFLVENSLVQKQDYLTTILSQLRKHKFVNLACVETMLLSAISDPNDLIANDAVIGLGLLKSHEVDLTASIDRLLMLASERSDPLRQSILNLVDGYQLSEAQEQSFTLLSIENKKLGDDDYLTALVNWKQTTLFPSSTDRIADIMMLRPDLRKRVIAFMSSCDNLTDLTDKALDNIIHVICTDDNVRASAVELLNLYSTQGGILNKSQDSALSKYKDRIKPGITNPTNIKKHVLSGKFEIKFLERYVEFFTHNQKELTIIPPKFIHNFFDVLKSERQFENPTSLFELAILLYSVLTDDDKIFIKILCEKNISSESARIRKCCFDVLMLLKEEGVISNTFVQHCSFLEKQITQQSFQFSAATRYRAPFAEAKPESKSTERMHAAYPKRQYDFLGLLTSLDHVDRDSLKIEDSKQRDRDLLLSNFAYSQQLSSVKLHQLYASWLNVENALGIDNATRLLLQLHYTNHINYDQLMEIVILLQQFSARDIEVLTQELENTVYPCEALKRLFINRSFDAVLETKSSAEYHEFIVKYMINRFSAQFIVTLFGKLAKIENLNELYSLFIHLETLDIPLVKITSEPSGVAVLRQICELTSLVKLGNFDRDTAIKAAMEDLLKQGWTYEHIKQLLAAVSDDSCSTGKQIERSKQLSHVLKIISSYRVSSNHLRSILAILCRDDSDWVADVNQFVMDNTSKKLGGLKDIEVLLDELTSDENNGNNKNLAKIAPTLKQYIEIVESKELKSRLQSGVDSIAFEHGAICEWSLKDIARWSLFVKNNAEYQKDPSFLFEMFAVIRRANYLDSGFYLTHTQLISAFVALSGAEDRGQLLQIATGEGKTSIAAVLAIVYCLQGKSPDIITSSPVLAERDALEKTNLYNMFGLTCDHNADKSPYIKGVKPCYKKDIVYGDAAQFQFDQLRVRYSELDTLGKRKNRHAIVDEVDCMLIDDTNKTARLASHVAGMESLQPVYVYLWDRLLKAQQRLLHVDGKDYFVDGEVFQHDGKRGLRYLESKGIVRQIPDIDNHLSRTDDISDIGCVIEGDILDCVKKDLNVYINKLISDGVVNLPSHLKEQFVLDQVPAWIESACLAYSYEKNIHYDVEDGKIKPIDFSNTGIIQGSTNWSDGLHQFLQIKHDLPMTSETLTTNFLSNVNFFRGYGSALTGLTGTLGSDEARHTLADIYQSDMADIPRTREQQFIELPANFCPDTAWEKNICLSVVHEVNKNRGVLIICKTIDDVYAINKMLRSEYGIRNSKLYTHNGKGQEEAIGSISPGDVIIATNLAGRGTDINTDEVEKYGGMHVVLAFDPDNKRIKQQNMGRTARKGKRGTAQIIAKRSTLKFQSNDDQSYDDTRDRYEKMRLAAFNKNELPVIEEKDKLFNKFCNFLSQLRKELKCSEMRSQLNSYTEQILSSIQDSSNRNSAAYCKYEQNILFAAEERWALFLKQNTCKASDDSTAFNGESLIEKYSQFEKILWADYRAGTLINNACYHTSIANSLVANDSWKNQTHAMALEHYKKAITLDPKNAAFAYIGRAWLRLKGAERLYIQNKHLENNKEKELAENDYMAAMQLIADEIAQLQSLATILQQRTSINSDIVRQLIQKITVLNSVQNNLKMNIDKITKSRRLIDIEQITQTTKDKSLSETSIMYGVKRKKGKDLIVNESVKTVNVTFHDLLRRYDCGQIDQAVDTIQAAYNKSSVKGDKVEIALSGCSADKVRRLFCRNTEFHEIPRNIALEQLQQRLVALSKLSKKNKEGGSGYVNLNVLYSHQPQEYQSIQLKDAISYVMESNDSDARFDLTFLNDSTPLNNIQNKDHRSVRLTSSWVSPENAEIMINKVKSESVGLTISANRSELLAAIRETGLTQITLIDDSTHKRSNYKRDDLCRFLEKDCKNDKPFSVYIENINQIDALKLTRHLKEQAKFRLEFSEFKDTEVLADCPEGDYELAFDSLSKEGALELVSILRDKQEEFDLRFKNLTPVVANTLIQKANLDEEHIEIMNVKPLADLFPEGVVPDDMMQQFTLRGFDYLLEINEQRFVPWWSVATVTGLASIQMLVGGALIATGFGATVGVGIITEGAADLFTAYRAYSSRSFTWEDYAKQKAISLAISAVSMGWQTLKSTSTDVKNVIQGAGEEILEQAGTRVVSNSKNVGRTLVESHRALYRDAVRQIGLQVSEAGTREVLNFAVDQVADMSLRRYQQGILKGIRNEIRHHFGETQLGNTVRMLYALDSWSETTSHENQLSRTVADVLNPEHAYWRKQWNSVGMPLLKGILSSNGTYRSEFSKVFRVAGMVHGVSQVGTLISTFRDEMLVKLRQSRQESLSLPQMFKQYLGVDAAKARLIADVLMKEKMMSPDGQFVDTIFLVDRYDDHVTAKIKPEFVKKLSCLDKNLEQELVKFLQFIYEKSLSVNSADTNQLVNQISTQLTEQMIQITESQLIAPCTTYMVSGVVNSASKKLQNLLVQRWLTQEIEEIDAEMAVITNNPDGISAEGHNRLAELRSIRSDKVIMANSPQDFQSQLDYNVKQYTTSYSEAKLVLDGTEVGSKKGSGEDKEVLDEANKILNGKPAGEFEMMTMASANNINLKIVDNVGYRLTQQDRDDGTAIVTYLPGEIKDGKRQIGHWCMMDSATGKFIPVESSGKDSCGYDVMSKLTSKPVDALRVELADCLLSNPQKARSAMDTVAWVKSHYPEEANRLLFIGGKRKKQKNMSRKIGKARIFLDPNVEVNLEADPVDLTTSQGSWNVIDSSFECADCCYDNKDINGMIKVGQISYGKLAFSCTAYLDPQTNQMIIAFKGSREWETFLKEDYKLATKGMPRSTKMAEIARGLEQIMAAYPSASTSFTGHSLGAAVATYYSSKFKKPAYCFDNPGIAMKGIDDSRVTSFQSLPNLVTIDGYKTKKGKFSKGNVVQLAAPTSKSARFRHIPGMGFASHSRKRVKESLDRTKRLCTDHSSSKYLDKYMRRGSDFKYSNDLSRVLEPQINGEKSARKKARCGL